MLNNMFGKTSMLAAAAAFMAFAPPALAQKDRGVSVGNSPSVDLEKNDDDIRLYQDAVKYYQANQIELARQSLDKFLGAQPSNAGGNVLMGLVQIQLNDLQKARIYFRTAVRVDPKMVSPKGYLGALEAALGDPAAAGLQREALVAMKGNCKGKCKPADIDEAIQRIDENLAANKKP